MLRNVLTSMLILAMLALQAGLAHAGDHGHKRSKWKDITADKKPFDKNCDYKVWVLEDQQWNETWYLEAFDAENAFYTINRQSTSWNDKDAFYALNFEDKSKFLIGENYIDVRTFSLCLKHE